MDARMIAHDMRTPLGALMYSIQAAKASISDPQAALHSLAIADRNVQALADIVEALVENSVSGGGTLLFQRCLPLDIVTNAIDQIAPQAEIRKLLITTGELVALPAIVADCTRLTRVLVNLLSNAVRFSPEGGRIWVDAKPRQNDGHPAIVFTVSDEGPGIKPEEVHRIFAEGVSIAKGGKKSSGLGLTVCKELVEAHQGRIWVEPTHEGATFSFSIPADRKLPSNTAVE